MRLIKRIARRLGYKLVPTTPVYFLNTDPISVLYRLGPRSALVHVSLSDCRSASGFTYGPINPHPLMRTAAAIIDGSAKCYRDSPLYELQCHLRTIPDIEKHRPVTNLPWLPDKGLSEKQKAKARMIENAKRGAALGADHGWTGFRYMSDEKGDLEFQALRKLVRSMQEKGYVRDDSFDGDVAVDPIIRGNEIRFIARNGKHRIAVAAALGMSALPVRMRPARVPRLAEVDHWPLVLAGYFSVSEATKLFNDVFDGVAEPDRVSERWREQIAT